MKLMSVVDTLLERKSLLLDALDEMDSCVSLPPRKRISTVEHFDHGSEFEEHYVWLSANLDETNERIQAALVHMQVMYGRGYASR